MVSGQALVGMVVIGDAVDQPDALTDSFRGVIAFAFQMAAAEGDARDLDACVRTGVAAQRSSNEQAVPLTRTHHVKSIRGWLLRREVLP